MPKSAKVALVEADDDDFVWLLEGHARNDDLLHAPLSARDREILRHVRPITDCLIREQCNGSWMIVSDREVVGLCGYHRPASAEREVEIGYNVFESRQKLGFMTAAVAELVKRARQDGAIDRIVADTTVANIASQRVLESNGFERGATRKDPADGLVLRWTLRLRSAS